MTYECNVNFDLTIEAPTEAQAREEARKGFAAALLSNSAGAVIDSRIA